MDTNKENSLRQNQTDKLLDIDTESLPLSHKDYEYLLTLIYDSATSPYFWPVIIDNIDATLTKDGKFVGELAKSTFHTPTDNPDLHKELSITKLLAPHLKNALQLNQQFSALEQQAAASTTFLHKLPVGVIVVNKRGSIVLKNQRANQIINQQLGLKSINNHLCCAYASDTKKLLQIIQDTINNHTNGSNSIFTIRSNTHRTPETLLITRLDNVNTNLATNNTYAAIFISSHTENYQISETALSALYELTPVESRLAKYISSGGTLEDYATQFNVSKNTARSQIRSIFDKTNTTSQAELTKQVLTSPAIWSESIENSQTQKEPSIAINITPTHRHTQFLTLADGRQLCYGEAGDANGIPVVLLHSPLGCRFEKHPDDSIAEEMGIRLISLDRAGFGLSTKNPDNSFLSGASDILALTESLDIHKFSLIGHSVGAIFALACAYSAPERVSRVSILNAPSPVNSVFDLKGVCGTVQLFYSLALLTPRLFSYLSRLRLQTISSDPLRFLAQFSVGSENDAKTLQDRYIRDSLHHSVCNSLQPGATGFIQDITQTTKHWGFDFQDINSQISIWRGEQTNHCTDLMVQKLRNMIPNSTYVPRPDIGLYFLSCWEDLLLTTTAGAKKPAS